MTVVVLRSFSQPLGYVSVGQLDFHISCTRVGELISAVGITKIPPHPFEFRWDVIVSVFLCNHLPKRNDCYTTLKTDLINTSPKHVTLTTCSLGRRLQSASVSSSPSRYLRVDSPSPLWHPDWTSSGSGLIRYWSSLARALFRLFSNAETTENREIQQSLQSWRYSVSVEILMAVMKMILIIFLLDAYMHWFYSALTSMLIWSCVFDISWEPGKYVVSCRVGFTVPRCKFGIPEEQDVNMMSACRLCCFLISCCAFVWRTYFGGASISSRYSSILLTSVRTSPWKVRKGGCVPGARLWRSAGFLISDRITKYIL